MNCKEYRYGIGADILESMDKNSDLPLPNVNRLAKTMAEYFRADGYVDDVKEHGYKWKPTEDYWRLHVRDFADVLRKERHKYFIFYREQGELRGLWQFATKAQYEETMMREYADVATRTDTFNDRVEDGRLRWKLTVPPITPVPALSVAMGDS